MRWAVDLLLLVENHREYVVLLITPENGRKQKTKVKADQHDDGSGGCASRSRVTHAVNSRLY